MPKLSVVVKIDDPLSKALLNGIPLHQLALDEAVLFASSVGAEIIKFTGGSLLQMLKDLDFDIVIVHDSLRPLVKAEQFERTLNALDGFDAVRPTLAFTETIKSVDSAGRLDQTIDREKVRRISSPEVIRKSAIDFEGITTTWSVPLKSSAKTAQIEADPAGIRINNADELQLMNAYLTLDK